MVSEVIHLLLEVINHCPEIKTESLLRLERALLWGRETEKQSMYIKSNDYSRVQIKRYAKFIYTSAISQISI